MKLDVKKIVICGASAILLLLIGIAIGLGLNNNKMKPVMLTDIEFERTMPQSELAEKIENNFWAFARASYILIGNPPDCEFYKIVKEVPRNNYDTERFYITDNSEYMYYYNEDGTVNSTLAIDVSAYQESIDWEAVKASGVTVAMIRVGYRGYGEEGKIAVDKMFTEHIEGALQAGLKVGVYFFSQALNYDEGVEEANFVINAISGYNISCPVAIDTEFVGADGARTLNLDVDSRTDGVVAFCETIKNSGYVPMIYSNRNWFAQSLDMTRLGGYKLWVAHYVNQPDFPYLYQGWQYTDQGVLQGVNGNVDLNVWFE